MEWMAELNGKPLDESYWRNALEEEHWRALMSQGEVAPPAYSTFFDAREGPSEERERPAADGRGATSEQNGALDEDAVWQAAYEALDSGELFTVQVTGANRGGLLIEWNGLSGFIPASHLRVAPRQADQQARVTELQARSGERLIVKLIEVDRTQKRLVFSERAALSGTKEESLVLTRLSPGDTCRGVVTNVTTFGAFVELGGVEGLIHISELSWDRVRHPGDVLRPGQEVEVYVVGVNPDQERIALSLKRLRPNPWSLAERQYEVGQIIEGTVTNVVSFGAFVRVEEGLEGLVHISEMAEGNFLHPRNVVREGDVVKVRVLNIDTANRRLGLSLRQVYNPGMAG